MQEYQGEGNGKRKDRCGRRRRRRSCSLEPGDNENVGQHRANMVVCPLGSLFWPPYSYNPQWDFSTLPLLFLMCCNYNNLGKQATELRISKPLLASTGSSRILGTSLKDITAGWGGLLFSASQWPLRDNLREDLSLGTSMLINQCSAILPGIMMSAGFLNGWEGRLNYYYSW